MPTPRTNLRIAAVGNKIYAIGGSVTSANEEYDIATDTWTQKAAMPTARSGFGIAVYQNKIYCIGGSVPGTVETGSLPVAVNQVYIPQTDTWITGNSMPTQRYLIEANVVNGKIYVMGGVQGLKPHVIPDVSNKNEVYDPATNSWSTAEPMPIPVFSYTSAVVDNKIYIIGGSGAWQSSGEPPPPVINQTQIYDTQTNSWSSGKLIPELVINAAAVATTGDKAPKRIYVFGGRTGVDGTTLCQVYDPKTNLWATGTGMPTARFGLAATVVNDLIYVIGGFPNFSFISNPFTVNEMYVPYGYSGTVAGVHPSITISSPKNVTYSTNTVEFNLSVDETVLWVSYSLDNNSNITKHHQSQITDLSDGQHGLVVYACDVDGNIGVSETVYFTVKQPLTTSPVPLITVTALVVVAGISVLLYFIKMKKPAEKPENK
jgi:N-acetylneuraminic acid mutarotase